MLHKVACPVVLLSLITAASINPHPHLDKKPPTKVTNKPPQPPLHSTLQDSAQAPDRGSQSHAGEKLLSRTPVLRGTGHQLNDCSHTASPLLPALFPDWLSRLAGKLQTRHVHLSHHHRKFLNSTSLFSWFFVSSRQATNHLKTTSFLLPKNYTLPFFWWLCPFAIKGETIGINTEHFIVSSLRSHFKKSFKQSWTPNTAKCLLGTQRENLIIFLIAS